jgi:hypothetical protein
VGDEKRRRKLLEKEKSSDVEEDEERDEGEEQQGGWVLGVGELEELKHSVRNMYHQDRFCGVDQFFDNHFA